MPDVLMRQRVSSPEPTQPEHLTTKNYVDQEVQAAQDASQPLDADLTAIAGLAPADGSVLARVAGAWSSRTGAQLKSDLALTKADVGLSNVDNTSDASKPVSTATQTALDSKQPLDSDLTAIAGLAPADGSVLARVAGAWSGRTTAQLKTDLALTKSDVGLGNVDNTSDTNKPVSTATQTALDGKQSLDADLTAIAALAPADGSVLARVAGAWSSRTGAQLKSDLALTKADVGLSNVDNTSDASKPVSTATQTALDAKAPIASPTFTGTVTVPRVVNTPVVLTDGATIATDAALGNHFRVTLGGNRTLGAPSNAVDGQRGLWEVIQDGTGNRTLALATGTGGFLFGTDITAFTASTVAGKRDFIGALYVAALTRWLVLATAKGY